MDWAKAKNILIIIFLALNVFLLIKNVDAFSPDKSVSSEVIQNTITILKGRGITLKCEIPTFNVNSETLIYDDSDFDRSKIVKSLLGISERSSIKDGETVSKGNKNIVFMQNRLTYNSAKEKDIPVINTISDAEKYIRKFLKEIEIPQSDFELDSGIKESKGFRLRFIEKSKEYLIFTNRVEAYIYNDGSVYFECNYKKVKSLKPNNKKVYNAYEILIKKFFIDTNSVITRIDIGFVETKLEADSKDMYSALVWRISTDNGKDRYFKVSDGEEIILET